MAHTIRLLVISLVLLFFAKSLSAITYNVIELGAKPDGKTDSTFAFQNAWTSACGCSQPACIYVPQGRYLLHQTKFNGPCKSGHILIKIDGTLVAPSDYTALGMAGNWIQFESVHGVLIHGGVLDGRGTRLWDCKASGKRCPEGATTLAFYNSRHIIITGLTSRDSEMFHILVYGCRNVKLQNIKVKAPGNSPNTDGIHVQLSSRVTILNSTFSTGDDCISIGKGTTSLWIENVACGPGHGISIGSLGWDFKEAGVHDVTVKTALFKDTDNGVRIKTWGKPSTSFVRGVVFQHITMDNVQNPIIIDQNYCPVKKGCPGEISGVKISNITYANIHGTSATEIAIKFDCSKKNWCSGLKLADINLTYRNGPARAWCVDASGKTYGTVHPASCLKA